MEWSESWYDEHWILHSFIASICIRLSFNCFFFFSEFKVATHYSFQGERERRWTQHVLVEKGLARDLLSFPTMKQTNILMQEKDEWWWKWTMPQAWVFWMSSKWKLASPLVNQWWTLPTNLSIQSVIRYQHTWSYGGKNTGFTLKFFKIATVHKKHMIGSVLLCLIITSILFIYLIPSLSTENSKDNKRKMHKKFCPNSYLVVWLRG